VTLKVFKMAKAACQFWTRRVGEGREGEEGRGGEGEERGEERNQKYLFPVQLKGGISDVEGV
jgi:hypothetical protein